MVITRAGFFLLPIGIILCFFSRKYLFYAMLFFAPFSGMSVMNFNISTVDFGLQPGYWFGGLYIFKYLLYCIRVKKIRFAKVNVFCNFFIILVVISIIMCLLIGEYHIDVYGIGNGIKIISAKFSSTNITMLLYLLFCYIIYVLTKTFYLKENKIEYGYFVLGSSAIAMCFVGIIQKLSINNSDFFNSIFRSNPSSWNQTNTRIQAATGESSVLGMFLAISLCYFLIQTCERSFVNLVAMLFVLLIGIYSRSSTFVVGALTVFISYIFLNINSKVDKRKLKKNVGLFLGIVAIVVGIYMLIPESINLIISKTINKFNLSDKSGSIRLATTIQMIKVGMKYPIWGVGYGTGRATDLFSTLFGTVGIGGLGSFLLFVLTLLRRLDNVNTNKLSMTSKMMLFTFLVCSIAIPDLNYIYIWILFGMIEALGETKCSNNFLTEVL